MYYTYIKLYIIYTIYYYVKILKPISIIDFGTNQMIARIERVVNDITGEEYSEINFKVNYGTNVGKEFMFKSNEHNAIRFGRKSNPDINVVFADDSTSRLQCT